LRAHGLIAKVPKTHRYQLTDQGRTSISALLAARTSAPHEAAVSALRSDVTSGTDVSGSAFLSPESAPSGAIRQRPPASSNLEIGFIVMSLVALVMNPVLGGSSPSSVAHID